MAVVRRAVGVASRRLGRPELLAVVDPGARQAEQESVAINAVLAAALRRDSSYVDVGANRGQVLAEALRVAPEGRHVAFEPIPSLAAELTSRYPSVETRQLALGAEGATAQFCHFRSLDGWSGLRRSPEISDDRGHPQFIDVQVSTLDAELAELTPSVVKIDVEGAELAVFQGARALLARARPLVIFEHVAAAAALYDATPEALWDVLSEAGYAVFSVTGDGPFERSSFARASGVVNWLAAPRLRA